MKVTIYHNPRCSKSRETLELLRDRGIEPEIIEYLVHPPGPQRLRQLLRMLDMKPRELMRRNEEPYRTYGLDDERLSEKDLIQAMVDHPILIQRPIVVAGERAAIGRPPEGVLRIL